MAQQQQNDDYADDIINPDELQANITAQDDANVAKAPNQFQQNNALMQAGGNQFGQGLAGMTGNQNIGDPRVVQARQVSAAMQQIIQNSNENSPSDESPIDKQQRLAQAVAAGMANISPQIALKANMQAVAMQQAKQQQALLQAQTANEQQTTADNVVKNDAAKMGQVYQVHGVATGKDGLPIYKAVGDPIPMYNPDGSKNPDFNTQLQANIALAKQQGLSAPQFSTVDKFQNSKDQVALIRAQAQAAQADKKAQSSMGLTPDAVANSAVLSIVAPNTVTRFSKDDKEAIANFMAQRGISGVDAAAAQSQMRALNAASVAQGTRVGNITTMEQSIDGKNGLAQQVLNTLGGVDRTRFPALNSGIVAMKNAAGSGPEAAYSTAIQGLVTEYARVISGGTGITSDEARKQATDLLSKASSPEAVRAVVAQIRDGELKAIKNGSDQAIELIAHPERYGAIVRLQQKAGIPVVGLDPDSPPTYTPAGGQAQVTAPQRVPASTGWGTAMKVSP